MVNYHSWILLKYDLVLEIPFSVQTETKSGFSIGHGREEARVCCKLIENKQSKRVGSRTWIP